MIKKTTTANFLDGDYKGEYDWQGGVPLAEEEIISVKVNNITLDYKLIKKEIKMEDKGGDQIVDIIYTFNLK